MRLFSKKTEHKHDIFEEQLISAAKAGDSRAFAELVCKYERRIRSLGMSFFKNTSDCDDFVQDVCIKIFKGLPAFRGDSLFSTWILRIAYNTAVNSIKRRKEFVSLPQEFDILDTSLTPEEKQIRDVTAKVIRDCVAELPEKFRSCLDLYFYYDMSYVEISVITDLPVNTIKSHVFRAKKILKDRLSEAL